MSESIHEKGGRVRRPRVHLKFKVETEGAEVETELPFVIGILGDYTGNAPQRERPMLQDRKLVDINRGNFDEVMAKMGPGLSFGVENTLEGKDKGKEMRVNLAFNSMADFEPARVAEQIEPLRRLLEARNRLRDLMNKVDRSQPLEKMLEEILKDKDAFGKLHAELGLAPPDGTDAPKEG
jgi:type VI secretion system protein ImpB